MGSNGLERLLSEAIEPRRSGRGTWRGSRGLEPAAPPP